MPLLVLFFCFKCKLRYEYKKGKSWIGDYFLTKYEQENNISLSWYLSLALITAPLGPVNSGYPPIKWRRKAKQEQISTPVGYILILLSNSHANNVLLDNGWQKCRHLFWFIIGLSCISSINLFGCCHCRQALKCSEPISAMLEGTNRTVSNKRAGFSKYIDSLSLCVCLTDSW